MDNYIETKHAPKACSFCGQLFTPKRVNGIYCSKQCKDNASKVRRNIEPVLIQKKICLGCGKEFETQFTRKEYCCKSCVNRASWKRNYVPKPRIIKPKKEKPPVEFETRTCVICNKMFEVNRHCSNKTCSHDCSIKYKREIDRQRLKNREKRIARVLVDKDINLETLRRRDFDICWICGEKTNPYDYKIINGTIIVGETYPSIDHVLPLARGGMHQWENVRLAHKGCNQRRGATLCDKVDELTKEEARRYAREICQNKKEVIQFINGVEYARYESTVEAAKINGFKSKSIQEACKGGKTGHSHRMYGYEWKYSHS